MPPSSLSQTQAPQKKSKATRPKTVKLGVDRPSSGSQKKANPLQAFTKFASPVPSSCIGSSSSKVQPSSQSRISSRKGKKKAVTPTASCDDTLWVDKYEPKTEAELAVHVRKVDDIRRWLKEALEGGPSGKLTKYRRILVLTGPAGTGKTTTLRILSQSMNFDILEWKNALADGSPPLTGEYTASGESSARFHSDTDYESSFSKFEAFLNRASACNDIFGSTANTPSRSTGVTSSAKRRLILLEELPNILHANTHVQFHNALRSLIMSPPSNPHVPVVIIISDTGIRGEARDESITEGRGWGKEKDQIVDIRTVLPKDVIGGPYVTEISFNPIAPTLLKKAVQSMLNRHFGSEEGRGSLPPSKEVVDMIVESANGDIRSAIMALQFACVVQVSTQKKRGSAQGTQFVVEAVTRREQSLALFHLLGKVLYNKRKDDPSNPSATAKDIRRDQELDASLKDQFKLPHHLSHHERRRSRVDVNTLYADSPIDSSLFSLYIHQNYTPFCNELEETEGVAEWLSWVDSSGGDMWYQANPHQFHLLTLGTLHSLPSPVPRRSQKYFKPEFFAYHQKQNESVDAVRMTKDWLVHVGTATEESGWRAGGWSTNDVALELGGVLKARDQGAPTSFRSKAPIIHRRFSRLEFFGGASSMSSQLNEGDVDTAYFNGDDETLLNGFEPTLEVHQGGWLESDDIQEFN